MSMRGDRCGSSSSWPMRVCSPRGSTPRRSSPKFRSTRPILRAAPGNGGGKAGSEYGVEAYNLYVAIGRIKELGVVLKDLDMSLLDFPHERGGRIVFLCWHPPEERVEYWHDLDAGYAGRQPL